MKLHVSKSAQMIWLSRL